LPEDDGPTMTGTPGERRADHARPAVDATDGDDTTTAQAGPPASRREDPSVPPDSGADEGDDTGSHDPHAHEDRTVQQKVDPPLAARKPSGLAQRVPASGAAKPASAPPPRPPAPVPAAGVPASAPVPSTEPGGAMVTAPAPPPVTRSTETDIEPTDITDELDDDLTEDEDDPVEDSITATAPRISHSNLTEAAQSGHGLPISIPGSVEIRTVEHDDDMLDETEVRTRPGHSPLHIPVKLRGSPAPLHSSSQPPPPPRPAAGRPPTIAPGSEGVVRAAARAASPRPAAGMPFQPDVVDDPPTRPGVEGAIDGADELATRPGVEGADEPPTRPGVSSTEEPATSPGLGESPTRPGAPDPDTAERLDVKRAIDAATSSYANEDDDEDDDDESVTTRGRVAEPYEEDESVTTQAPAVPHSIIEAAIKAPNGILHATLDDDGTGGTNQLVKKREAALASPADGESESITTQAPGPLTNILRVIASGSSPELGSDPGLPLLEEDEPPENRTAVMANAPLKRIIEGLASASSLPAIRPTGGPMLHGPHGPQGSAALRLEPSSESGLRVARAGGVDRASLGALGIADASGRHSGIGRTASALASDGSISAQMNGDLALFPSQVQPSVHDVDLGKGPRYGLLVAIVAVISVVVPATLFVALHYPAETLVPGVPAEPASEVEKHDGSRVKAVRGKNGQMVAPSGTVAASAAPSVAPAPSTSASTRPPGGAKGSPFRR
jgi:hypothetical protein